MFLAYVLSLTTGCVVPFPLVSPHVKTKMSAGKYTCSARLPCVYTTSICMPKSYKVTTNDARINTSHIPVHMLPPSGNLQEHDAFTAHINASAHVSPTDAWHKKCPTTAVLVILEQISLHLFSLIYQQPSRLPPTPPAREKC